jgi:hypothetical protein
MGYRVPFPPRDISNMIGNNRALSLLPVVSKGIPTQGARHKRSQEKVEEELNTYIDIL